MTLNQITKVKGPGIHTQANIVSNSISLGGIATASNFKTGTTNIHSAGVEAAGINVLGADTPIGTGATIYNSGAAVFTGVVTATKFVGQADITGGSIVGTSATFTGNVSIGGTLTYEDVTNIDSVGIVTARAGIKVTGGNVELLDDRKLRLGTGNDLNIYHENSSTTNWIEGTGLIRIQTVGNIEICPKNGAEKGARFVTDGAAELYFNGSKKFETTADGATVTGALNLTGASSGNYINVGSSTVYANAAINIHRNGNGYADMRLASNYGAKVALAGASNNTDEFFIQQDNQKNAYIYNEAAKDIIFGTSNTERLRITSDGLVAIGHDSPSSFSSGANNLVVRDAAGAGGITIVTPNNVMGSIFFADSTSATGQGRIRYDHNGDYMTLNTNATERLRITSGGSVRIGGSTPVGYSANANVDDIVVGGTSSHGITILTGNSSTGSLWFDSENGNRGYIQYAHNEEALILGTEGNERARITSTGALLVGGHTARIQTYSSSGGTLISSFSTGANGGGIELGGETNSNGYNAGSIFFVNNTNSNASLLENANSKIVGMIRAEIVTSDSNAGDDCGADITFRTKPEAGASAERLRIASDGKVGINELTPERQLDVNGDILGTSYMLKSNSSASSGSQAHMFRPADNTLAFATNGANERLRIDSGGRIGLGINNPSAYFSSYNRVVMGRTNDTGGMTIVSGSGSGGYISFADGTSGSQAYSGVIAYQHSADYMTFATNGGTERVRIDSSGRVHIGSSNNTGSNTKLVVGAGNNINTTCLINTGDVDTDALTLSNWDGSTTTNKVMMHFDCSGIGGWNIGMPAATDAFVIEDDGGTEKLRIHADGRVTTPINSNRGGIGMVGAFRARVTSVYDFPSGTRKIILGTEEFDANGWFDHTTNYRYTPLCKGWYQLHFHLQFKTGINNNAIEMQLYPYFNGASTPGPVQGWDNNHGNYAYNSWSTIMYFNGTTDYVEFYGNCSHTTDVATATHMMGYLVHPVA